MKLFVKVKNNAVIGQGKTHNVWYIIFRGQKSELHIHVHENICTMQKEYIWPSSFENRNNLTYWGQKSEWLTWKTKLKCTFTIKHT